LISWRILHLLLPFVLILPLVTVMVSPIASRLRRRAVGWSTKVRRLTTETRHRGTFSACSARANSQTATIEVFPRPVGMLAVAGNSPLANHAVFQGIICFLSRDGCYLLVAVAVGGMARWIKVGGKETSEGLGWTSEGWSEKKAAAILAELKANATVGTGPRTPTENESFSPRFFPPPLYIQYHY
jgi:hypothetical protein